MATGRDLTILNLFDGELVLDHKANPEKDLQEMPTFLVFDALVVNSVNVMALFFRERLEKAEAYIVEKHTIYRLMRQNQPYPGFMPHFV